MKWYHVQFDRNWVTCKNFNCKTQFTADAIKRRRKCPICKMDNSGCIKVKDNNRPIDGGGK